MGRWNRPVDGFIAVGLVFVYHVDFIGIVEMC